MKHQQQRFKEVRLSLKKMPQQKFARMSGISVSTVQKIEAGLMELSESTLDLLENNCNVNPLWIKTGKGEMFKEGQAPEVDLLNDDADSPWKNEALQNLKAQVRFYEQLLMQVTGGKGFLTLISKKPHPAPLRMA